MKASPSLRVLALSALVAASVAAVAAPTALVPNQLLASVPQTNTFLGDLVIDSTADFTGIDFDGTVLFTGTLSSAVYRQGDNTLAFAYFVENDATSIDAIERLSISSFNGFTTSVEQGTPSGDLLPTSSASRSANGNVVSFGYAPGSTFGSIMPGTETRYVVVYTNATEYRTGSAQFISGGVGTSPTFVPSPVPEPATMAALGLGAAALLRRRRRS